MCQMSHQGMKISTERCFFLNILTFGGVGCTFCLMDAVQLTAGYTQIGGNLLNGQIVCNSGIAGDKCMEPFCGCPYKHIRITLLRH